MADAKDTNKDEQTEKTEEAEKVKEEKKTDDKSQETETASESTGSTNAETNPEAELSKDGQKVMEIVERMTVLELADLVKALEKKFGVSAAAPAVAVGASTPNGAADAGEAAEEKSEYDVVITSPGDKKIAVIKVVRELDQTLGLVDAKNKVDEGEAVILEKAKKEEAKEAKKKLEEAGATVELR